jgi:hypothetical protein
MSATFQDVTINSVFGNYALPSRPTYAAEMISRVNVDSEFQKISAVIDTPDVQRSITAALAPIFNRSQNADLHIDAITESTQKVLETFFKDSSNWQKLRDHMTQVGAECRNLANLLEKYDDTNKTFIGDSNDFVKSLHGAVRESLAYAIKAHNTPSPLISLHADLNNALDNLSRRVGTKDPKTNKIAPDSEKALNLIVDAVKQALNPAPPAPQEAEKNISIGKNNVVEMFFSNNKVIIESALSEVRATFEIAATPPTTESETFKELLEKLTQGRKPAAGDLITEAIPTIEGSPSYEQLLVITKLLSKYAINGITFEKKSNDIHPFNESIPTVAAPLTMVRSFETSDKRVLDLEAQITALKGTLTANPSHVISDTDIQQLINTISSKETISIQNDPAATNCIKSIDLRTELGEYYADVTVKDKHGHDAVISFRINGNGEDISEVLKRVSLIAESIATDPGTSVANSKTILDLLDIAQIQSVTGKAGGAISFENVTWLGGFLAADARFENVTFENSNIDLAGVRTQITNCSFTNSRVSLLLEQAKIENCSFSKDSVLSGRIKGTFKDGSIHSHAYALDMRELNVESKDLRKAFHGVLLNKSALPQSLLKIVSPISDGRKKFEDTQLEERFNHHAIRALIHDFSEENLTRHRSLHIDWQSTRTIWKITQASTPPIHIDQGVIVSKHNPLSATPVPPATSANDESIDIYPAHTDITTADDDTEVLRVLIDKNGKMVAVKTTHGALANFALVDSLPEATQSISGNQLIYDSVLDFCRYNRWKKEKIDPNNMVTVTP